MKLKHTLLIVLFFTACTYISIQDSSNVSVKIDKGANPDLKKLKGVK